MTGKQRPARPGGAARAGARRLGHTVAERPWLLTALLCGLVALSGLHGPDFPAQAFRAWLFRAHGALLFDGQWYAGHLLPGYSMLFPLLAGTLGTIVVGTASCVTSTWLATRLVGGATTTARRVGLCWFAVITVADLVIGRLSFALGMSFGLAALLATQRRRPWLTGLAAGACSLASPLAAGFLLLAAIAWLPSIGWRRFAPLLAAAAGLGVAAVFGGAGRFPFPWSSLVAILIFAAVGLALCPRRYPSLRRGMVLYALSALILFVVPNPVGGNLTRLGTLLAGPVAALVLWQIGRRRVLVLAAAPLLFWQLQPVYGAVAASVHDPSAQPAYYAGLLQFLTSQPGPPQRVEIPLTRSHWESVYVATKVPLARGWERQLDTAYDGVLYSADLTAAAYHQWLLDEGVRYVALPDVPLDAAEAGESQLLVAGQPWLRPVWSDQHWQVWAVTDAAPMVVGPASLVRLDVQSFVVDFTSPGTAEVLVHYTRFFTVTLGVGCVAPGPDGWTLVQTQGVGAITVSAQFGLSASSCPP